MCKLTEFRQNIIPTLSHGPFFKNLSLHFAQKSSVWKMSSAVADKDLGNLELVPSHLIYSLVRFLCTLCCWLPCYLLFSLPCQSNLFIVDFLSTVSWDIIYCSWVPTSIWALKFYCYKSLFLYICIFRKRIMVEMSLLPLCYCCFTNSSASYWKCSHKPYFEESPVKQWEDTCSLPGLDNYW